MKKILCVLAVLVLMLPLSVFGANTVAQNGKVIVLDTFTSAIDVNVLAGKSINTMEVLAIQWQGPTTVGHTATVTDAGGNDLFNETCVTANQTLNLPLYGVRVDNLKIAISGVGSGKIRILLK